MSEFMRNQNLFHKLSILLCLLLILSTPVLGQEATPLRVEIITSTPLPLDESTPTPTYTPSPDVQSAALLQAKADAGEVNVRAQADIEADILGKIRFGDEYVITGRYFRWYQFRYPPAPNGIGWVFEELIEISGNQALIVDLSAIELPTSDPAMIAATETASVLLLTPGAILTANVDPREVQGVVAVGAEVQDAPVVINQTALPTFTPPAAIAALSTDIPVSGGDEALNEETATAQSTTRGDMPPIVPIAILGGLGLFGLVISALRR